MRSLEAIARQNGDRDRMQQLLGPCPEWVLDAAMLPGHTDAQEAQRQQARNWILWREGHRGPEPQPL